MIYLAPLGFLETCEERIIPEDKSHVVVFSAVQQEHQNAFCGQYTFGAILHRYVHGSMVVPSIISTESHIQPSNKVKAIASRMGTVPNGITWPSAIGHEYACTCLFQVGTAHESSNREAPITYNVHCQFSPNEHSLAASGPRVMLG
jgi:hypothetical protein